MKFLTLCPSPISEVNLTLTQVGGVFTPIINATEMAVSIVTPVMYCVCYSLFYNQKS